MTSQRRPVSRRGPAATAPATRGAAAGTVDATLEEDPGEPLPGPGSEPMSDAAIRAARAEERRVRIEEPVQRSVLTERTGRLRGLFDDTRAELKKITWPDRDTTRNLTVVVIGVSVVLGIVLGGIDYVLFQIFEAIP